jgi:NADPH:quinone reductase-like Zn-dependent oxidoreductase
LLVTAPRTVGLADAAALPLVGLTAWQALFEHAGLQRGQSVLINGGGGGVGGYAIQLAKRAGATVTATASERSRDRVLAYGADTIIDYTTTPLPTDERFDVVLHLVREEPAGLVELVADGGVFVSTTTSPADARVRVEQVFVRTDAAQLAELVSLVDAGKLHIDVAQRRPLADLAAVHDQAMAGKLAGKTVLIP